MNKYLLGLTAATFLYTPFVSADNTTTGNNTGQTVQTTAPDTVYIDAQIKTADGKICNVKVDPTDLQNLKAGSKIEIIAHEDNAKEDFLVP